MTKQWVNELDALLCNEASLWAIKKRQSGLLFDELSEAKQVYEDIMTMLTLLRKNYYPLIQEHGQ